MDRLVTSYMQGVLDLHDLLIGQIDKIVKSSKAQHNDSALPRSREAEEEYGFCNRNSGMQYFL